MSTPAPTGRPFPDLQDDLPQPPDERVGFAIVGLGAYALGQIIPNLSQSRRSRLAAVVSGNADKARTVARAYGLGDRHVYSYDTFDDVAEAETVDAVYVILPNTMHRAWTERAFEAGKHVLCEKPMAVTVEDCEAMIAAAEQAGKKLMIGYRAQYDPINRRAIELVRGEGDDGSRIGTPRLVIADHGRILDLSATRDEWRAQKELAGGGSLYDIGIYSLNGARYLLGEEPIEVTARYTPGSGRDEVDVEEGVVWSMQFPSGAVANCSSSYLVGQSKQMRVYGSDGEVTLDPATDYYARNLYLSNGNEETHIVIPNPNQFAAMLDEMAAAVQEDRAPKTPGEEGLRDVRIMQAIYESAASGRPVTL